MFVGLGDTTCTTDWQFDALCRLTAFGQTVTNPPPGLHAVGGDQPRLSRKGYDVVGSTPIRPLCVVVHTLLSLLSSFWKLAYRNGQQIIFY